jgi:hypothetical protein
MNTIFFSRKHELKPGYYVIPFSCSDILNVNTEALARDRTDYEFNLLHSVRGRITKALLDQGFELVSLNFSSMSISATSTKAVQQSA